MIETIHCLSESSRFYGLARNALLEALRLIGCGKGDSVLVPAFICRDVLAPVYMTGAVPVFYDVDDKLAPISFPTTQGVRAILAVHYFGFPQDLSPFRAYCAESGASLIEDNAHGFLSRDASGAFLGSQGDFGLFSIRKTLLMPDGAMLLVNNQQYMPLLAPQEPFRKDSLSFVFRLKMAFSFLQRRTTLPLGVIGQELIRFFRKTATGHAISLMNPEEEFCMPERRPPHTFLQSVLRKLEPGQESLRRRRLYDQFDRICHQIGGRSVFDQLPPNTVPYGYPFYVDSPEILSDMTKASRAQGLDCIHWPELPGDIVADAPFHYTQLWLVNFLC